MFEKFFRKIEVGSEGKSMPKDVTPPEIVKSEKLPDYIINEQPGRLILYVPRWKCDQVGGRDGLLKMYEECFGSQSLWSDDFGDFYAIEVRDNKRDRERNDKLAAEEFKKAIEEELSKK